MESFSHLTVQLPSLSSSQIQELAQAIPAPVFCIITAVTENEVQKSVYFSRSMEQRRCSLMGMKNLVKVYNIHESKSVHKGLIIHESFMNSPFFCSEFQSVSRIVKIVHSALH